MVWHILQKLTNKASEIVVWESTSEHKHLKNSVITIWAVSELEWKLMTEQINKTSTERGIYSNLD
jgi:hypothetical protein